MSFQGQVTGAGGLGRSRCWARAGGGHGGPRCLGTEGVRGLWRFVAEMLSCVDLGGPAAVCERGYFPSLIDCPRLLCYL